MPKYYQFAVCGYYLYFTSACVIEAFHVHASDTRLTESGSAKFFVHEDGTVKIMKKGRLSDKSLKVITEFISVNYQEMYLKWLDGGGSAEFYHK